MRALPKDGGPAFPEAASGPYPNGEINEGRPGMSLRDWFAGQWLSGLGACPDTSCSVREIAIGSYQIADAMLAAREGKEGA
jgi:hypothetical protein